jgi:hypothetical protein
MKDIGVRSCCFAVWSLGVMAFLGSAVALCQPTGTKTTAKPPDGLAQVMLGMTLKDVQKIVADLQWSHSEHYADPTLTETHGHLQDGTDIFVHFKPSSIMGTVSSITMFLPSSRNLQSILAKYTRLYGNPQTISTREFRSWRWHFHATSSDRRLSVSQKNDGTISVSLEQ